MQAQIEVDGQNYEVTFEFGRETILLDKGKKGPGTPTEVATTRCRIIRKGKADTAIAVGKAYCSPKDTFDPAYGCKEAFERATRKAFANKEQRGKLWSWFQETPIFKAALANA